MPASQFELFIAKAEAIENLAYEWRLNESRNYTLTLERLDEEAAAYRASAAKFADQA